MKVLIILILPTLLLDQDNYVFGPSIRVSDDPPGTSFHSTYSSGQHSIGCRRDTVYLVWSDERIDPRAVYFSRSTDGGNTWSANLRLSGSDPDLEGFTPGLALDNQGNIYVCYTQADGFNLDVYFTKSTDGGVSFSTPILVNDTTRQAQDYPSIAVDSSGQTVFIAWRDARNLIAPPNFDVYISKSTDGGLNFLPSVRVDDTGADTSDQNGPSIGCTRSGDTVYVAWDDERNRFGDDNFDVYFSRSVDGGVSFGPDILVNDTVGTNHSTQGSPSLWISELGNIYVVWRDNRFGPYQVYFAKSIDAGQTFIGHCRVTDTPNSGGIPPSICSRDDTLIYVVWKDARTYSQTGSDIYFSFSSDGGSTFSPNVMVNDTMVMEDAWQWDPTICVNESCRVYVAWSDDRYFGGGPGFDIFFAAGQYVGIAEEISRITTENFIQLYPNPFQHYLTIRCGGEIEKIEIFDVLGRSVKDVATKNEASSRIDVSDLPHGIYFVRLETPDFVETEKVILLK